MKKNTSQKLDLKTFEERLRKKKEKREMKRGLIGKYSLNEDQLARIYSSITDLRDLALIKLAVFTGIRREDIVAVELHNIDWDQGTVSFYETKKSRQWECWINPDTLNVLRMYVNTLDTHERYLFPGRHQARGQQFSKTHLTGRAAYDIVQHWCIAAGLQKIIGEKDGRPEYEKRPFHALRSTCIKLLLKKGWSTEQVMRQTGDTLETIQLHYTVPTDSEMIDVARKTDTGIPETDLPMERLRRNLEGRWDR